MFLADYVRVQNPRRGLQRIDCGIDTQLGYLTAEHRSGVEMRERRRGSGVGQVVGRHVHRLHGSDGTVLCGSDPFLQSAHLRLQRRLITDGARHPAQQGRYLGARLRETENVINKQKNVFSSPVTEIFRDGKAA